jgi:type 1 fimbria pilin
MPLNAPWQWIAVLGLLGLMPGTSRAITCAPVGIGYFHTFPVPALNTDPALPVGSVIGTASIPVPNQQVRCVEGTPNSNTLINFNFADRWDAANRWFLSTRPGIGYRLYRNNVQILGLGVSITTYPSAGTFTANIGTYRVDYIRTGSISGGTFSHAFGAGFGTNGTGNTVAQLTSAPIVVPPEPKPPTCSVSPGSQQVSLGNIVTSAFGALNAEAGSGRATVSFVCAGATGGATRTIRLTLTDATSPANRSSNLSITGGSTARGVAVRMRNGATLISYGPDSNAANNPGQFLVKAGVGNETVTLPLDVSYIRTGTVTPGSAHATATFTVRYE